MASEDSDAKRVVVLVYQRISKPMFDMPPADVLPVDSSNDKRSFLNAAPKASWKPTRRPCQVRNGSFRLPKYKSIVDWRFVNADRNG